MLHAMWRVIGATHRQRIKCYRKAAGEFSKFNAKKMSRAQLFDAHVVLDRFHTFDVARNFRGLLDVGL